MNRYLNCFALYWEADATSAFSVGTVFTVSDVTLPDGYEFDSASRVFTKTLTQGLYSQMKQNESGVNLLVDIYVHKTGSEINICERKGYIATASDSGDPYKPNVVVTDGYGDVLSSNYYTVNYSSKVSGSTVYVTVSVTGKNGYCGTLYCDETYTSHITTEIAETTETAKTTETTETTKTLGSCKVSKLTNTGSGIKITWSSVSGADGYYIYRKSGSGKYSKIKTVTKTSTVSYTDGDVKNNTTYTYKVLPYSGSTTGSGTTKKIVCLTGTSLSKVKNSSAGKANVKWTAVSGVTGYQIQYSTSKTFASGNKTKKVSGKKSTSKTLSGLKKGKTYYVRIRTYKTVNGKIYYSAWSSKKSVKISK